MKNKTKYKIEPNIPLPSKKTKNSKYPFAELNKDDSFYAPVGCAPLLGVAKSWAKRSKKKWKFTTRKEGKGARIWRIK